MRPRRIRSGMLEVRLLDRTADALARARGLPLEEAVAEAFRRGLGVLSGREPLPNTEDAELDDLIATVMETEAGEALNAWRVLHRLRQYENLEPEVERLQADNKRLTAQALPNLARSRRSTRQPLPDACSTAAGTGDDSSASELRHVGRGRARKSCSLSYHGSRHRGRGGARLRARLARSRRRGELAAAVRGLWSGGPLPRARPGTARPQ